MLAACRRSTVPPALPPASATAAPGAGGSSPPPFSARGWPSSTAPWSTSPCPPSGPTWAWAPPACSGPSTPTSSPSAPWCSWRQLGDLYGRRRVFITGLGGFVAASLLCGLAPNAGALIAARALQGAAAAFLVPGSLALISASFHPDDRSRAVGAWSGLAGGDQRRGPLPGRLAGGRRLLAARIPPEPAPGSARRPGSPSATSPRLAPAKRGFGCPRATGTARPGPGRRRSRWGSPG